MMFGLRFLDILTIIAFIIFLVWFLINDTLKSNPGRQLPFNQSVQEYVVFARRAGFPKKAA